MVVVPQSYVVEGGRAVRPLDEEPQHELDCLYTSSDEDHRQGFPLLQQSLGNEGLRVSLLCKNKL